MSKPSGEAAVVTFPCSMFKIPETATSLESVTVYPLGLFTVTLLSVVVPEPLIVLFTAPTKFTVPCDALMVPLLTKFPLKFKEPLPISKVMPEVINTSSAVSPEPSAGILDPIQIPPFALLSVKTWCAAVGSIIPVCRSNKPAELTAYQFVAVDQSVSVKPFHNKSPVLILFPKELVVG